MELREAEHTESLILYNMLWPTNPNPYSLKAFCMQCFSFANVRHIFHTNVSDIFHCATFSYQLQNILALVLSSLIKWRTHLE